MCSVMLIKQKKKKKERKNQDTRYRPCVKPGQNNGLFKSETVLGKLGRLVTLSQE